MLLGCSVVGNAQLTVRDAFVSMPDTLCPFLDVQQRAYLLNVAPIGDTIPNRFDGQTVLKERTERTVGLQVADGVEYTIFLQNDTITFIQTACAPVCASVVKQYDAAWHYLQTITPSIQGIFVEAMLQDGTIVYKDNTPELLDEDEKKAYQRSNSSTF